MFPMPMHNPWVAGPILRRASMPRDPTLSVKLYSWSSEEFREECALVYTSRSNPSHTCVSHWRANRYKVLFTLQDCLCVGNPVIIHMEIKAERDHRGFYAIREFRIRNLSGRFMEQTNRRGLSSRQYRDTFHHREGELEYSLMEIDEADIDFTTGLAGGPGLTYTITVHCHPLKGIDVDLDGPECYFGDPYREQSIIGLCSVKYVEGKPPSNVLEQANVMQISESKEEKEGSSSSNNNIDGASNASSSSSSSTQNGSAILNAGNTQGALNGAIFNGCKFHLGD